MTLLLAQQLYDYNHGDSEVAQLRVTLPLPSMYYTYYTDLSLLSSAFIHRQEI